jgi:hypothetical protein
MTAGTYTIDPSSCSHEKMELGFEFLCAPARQCPDCGAWLDEEYEESFDGEEESCWFWLKEVSAGV